MQYMRHAAVFMAIAFVAVMVFPVGCNRNGGNVSAPEEVEPYSGEGGNAWKIMGWLWVNRSLSRKKVKRLCPKLCKKRESSC